MIVCHAAKAVLTQLEKSGVPRTLLLWWSPIDFFLKLEKPHGWRKIATVLLNLVVYNKNLI